MPQKVELTDREREVLQERAKSGSIDVIARRLNISPETVDFHLKNIRKKFGIEDTGVLLAEAVRQRLID